VGTVDGLVSTWPTSQLLTATVHAADVSEDVESASAGFGLLAIGVGGPLVEDDDHRLLERAIFVHDARYEWCAVEVERARRT
jgi:hypothetical protein